MSYDVIIIGGGPAGLTAAIYAGRAKLKTLVLDKKTPGGQLNDTTEVENFPGFPEPILGPELMQRMVQQAQRFGAEITLAEATDLVVSGAKRIVKTDQGLYEAPVVIISTGAEPVKLPAKNADRFVGRGVSYCATCDGYFFRDKDILVVGAGDSAFTEALFLLKLVKSVRMVVRHPPDDPKAIRAKDQLLVEKVKAHPKFSFIWNVVVEEIVGERRLEGVVLKDLATGKLSELRDVAGVFVSIGHRPNTEFLQGRLEMDEKGYILTDERTRTKIPGVFAVGDVRKFSGEYAQAVIAAADGCIAALEARKYLEDGRWIE
ncbi:MAG: thioredoxin-disulfide reductase [Candidatus Bipolaricaulota bacterium]|nr:thioredoxin-disulfide reductase [Candidatus Bipolaricaulota bacterium]MDW8031130.1 thioredoxin-disulfide reductase [Candidatus Bipolaricaulota bacterium]